jgi:hypothetical protein
MNFKQTDGTWRHIGITSFVDQAGCQGGKPAGFTRTRSYLDWIMCAIQSGQPQSCSVITSTTTSAPTTMDCRSKPNGNYPDPINPCSGSFYMCSDGYAYRFVILTNIQNNNILKTHFINNLHSSSRIELPRKFGFQHSD